MSARLAPILLTLFLATGCGGSRLIYDPPAAEDSRRVSVERVVDGDTVEIRPALDGIEDVRFIGVDTPEKFGPGGPEPLAEAATGFTETAVRRSAGRVELRFDRERVDQYGRLLAYVYLPDGTMLNESLVRDGYAQVATFPPNVRHLREFKTAQEEAREGGVGIWGLPDGEICALANRGNGFGGGC